MKIYGFTLKWKELPEELRERKVEEYIGFAEENSKFFDKLTDKEKREEAENHIRLHFPICFI
ncbi:MAG: hypothetical protein QMD08_08010 [Actinomycetota bacterium]|nr:hypothetical protein [Actinomycetota bacterium]